MAADASRPLFLTVNLMAAHAPYSLVPEVPWSQAHKARFDPPTMPAWMAPYRMDRTPPALGLTERPTPMALSGEEAFAAGQLALQAADLAFIRDLYDGELIRIDKALSAIIDAWNRTGRGQGIVAVTSDHGEYLGEHGQIGHGFTVFTEVTRVPLVIAAPGRLAPGQVVDEPVQLSDVHDTLVELAGLGGESRDSLVPIVGGQPRQGPILAAAWPMAVWAERVGGRFAHGHRLYREGDDVLVMDSAGGAALFDARRDPQMRQDRAVAEPERLADLRAKASSAFPETPSSGRVRVPDEALRQLQALGYTE
jgi:arylsulfatase A-like enzyme